MTAAWPGIYLKARERAAEEFPLVNVAIGFALDAGHIRPASSNGRPSSQQPRTQRLPAGGADTPSACLAHCHPCSPLGTHSQRGTRASVWLLRFCCANAAPEQVVALRGLLGDRGQILGQEIALLHQRLGGVFHPAQVVLLGTIALLDG